MSAGAHGSPLGPATRIAVRKCNSSAAHPEIRQVTFCCFSGDARQAYEKELAAAGET